MRQIVADTEYARFEMPDGSSTLSLHTAPDVRPGSVSVHFECDDVDAAAQALRDRGIELEQDPVDQPYLWREAILRDPDGHPVFLFTAGENRLNPPWRLGGD